MLVRESNKMMEEDRKNGTLPYIFYWVKGGAFEELYGLEDELYRDGGKGDYRGSHAGCFLRPDTGVEWKEYGWLKYHDYLEPVPGGMYSGPWWNEWSEWKQVCVMRHYIYIESVQEVEGLGSVFCLVAILVHFLH